MNRNFEIWDKINNGINIREIKLRVVEYSRVSTDSLEQKKSLENQKETYRAMIDDCPNWQYIGGYADEAVTGSSVHKRIGFQNMLEDAKKGLFDMILVKSVSRFARNLKDCLVYVDRLKEYGVVVYFYEDSIISFNHSDEMKLSFMALGAEMESKAARSRTKVVFEQGIGNGKVYGNSKILGYRKDKCKLVIDPYEAEIVRFIYDKYVHERMGARLIARALAEQGLCREGGTEISTRTVTTVLSNPKYKGYYCGGKTQMVDMGGKRIRRNLPPEEWTMYRDENIPAIVSEEIWNAAERIRNQRTEEYHEYVKKPCNHGIYRYSGKIESGFIPGTHYMRSLYRYKRLNRECWLCRDYKDVKNQRVVGPTLYTDELDFIVYELLKGFVKDYSSITDEMLGIYKQSISKLNEQNSSGELEKRRIQIHKKQERLIDLYTSERLTMEQFDTQNEFLKKQLADIDEKITAIQNVEVETKKMIDSVENLRDSIEKLVNTPQPTKEIIDEFIDVIYVDPSSSKKEIKLDIRLKVGSVTKSYLINRNKDNTEIFCGIGNKFN